MCVAQCSRAHRCVWSSQSPRSFLIFFFFLSNNNNNFLLFLFNRVKRRKLRNISLSQRRRRVEWLLISVRCQLNGEKIELSDWGMNDDRGWPLRVLIEMLFSFLSKVFFSLRTLTSPFTLFLYKKTKYEVNSYWRFK